MSKSWLPLKDETLRSFCTAFAATITPVPATWGLARGRCHQPERCGDELLRRTGRHGRAVHPDAGKHRARDMSKQSLIALMRNLYKKVNAANLAADKREALGLPPADAEPSPIPAPAMKPGISILKRDENIVSIQLFDPADPNTRARPLGVSGAAIFSFVGEEAPNTEVGWKFQGNTTRMRIDVAFPASVTPGSKVWLTAFFFNPRAMSGPAATPVSTYLPGGAAMAA